MRMFVLPGLVAMAAVAAPLAAQGGARGGGGQRCRDCDSSAMVGAVRRSTDTQIADLTVDLAQHRILVEHLRSRLAEGSPEAPKTERERAELQSMLVVHSREMARIERELSARCGAATAVRGYVGVDVAVPTTERTSGGRTTVTFSYPVVTRVEPGSPAARAGIAALDTIITINRMDAREQSLEPYVREPGTKVTIGLARADGRRDVTVTVGPRPPTFGGACMQYRSVVFASPTGQNIVSVQPAGAQGGGRGGAMSGTVRTRVGSGVATGGTGEGGRGQVRIQMSPDSMMQGATFFVVPPGAGAAALFMSRGATGAIVAGAEVALINGGLKPIFAVDHGALVVNVAPRSPAEQAGILSGDVIVGAQGEAVTAIAVLQHAIQTAGDRRSVTLEIVRAKQPKEITLRW